ncbi:8-oxo-dGTP diphosphatase MutT [Vibrio sp. 10N.261.55.A7]|uniref:8-oxo-dGTP diphosphatase MutT n=1 Tax=Vibrio sp. 10N.261.55.A7 TaxID=1880851 RepID=UPI000C8486DE|nr:8-oxo-dGTP diphosphatase MutT [Vibrio sp. 10N.261.55.A7]PMJ98997.1 7,8-dihydro-8-oxoguanine-triphosphatase [Vibrio sp. 10N.261.55.A7]
MKRIHIVAGIIFNQNRSQVYITQRPEKSHKGGYWEFPGGKVELDETSFQAMARELNEEVGINVTEQTLLEHLEYDYPEKSLKFDFILIHDFEGKPYGREEQRGEWVTISDLSSYRFPEANQPIVDRVIKEFG